MAAFGLDLILSLSLVGCMLVDYVLRGSRSPPLKNAARILGSWVEIDFPCRLVLR